MTSEDILAEHALAQPLRPSARAAFAAEGVIARALTWTPCGQLSIAACDRVLFSDDGRFEFSRYLRHDTGVQKAIVLPLLDECGDYADVLAFRPGGPVGLWLGRVSVAGAEQLLMPRPDLGDALDVHTDVFAWLRAGRNGIVVLDGRKAADDLAGTTLRVTDPGHAHGLCVALSRPAPKIVIADRVSA